MRRAWEMELGMWRRAATLGVAMALAYPSGVPLALASTHVDADELRGRASNRSPGVDPAEQDITRDLGGPSGASGLPDASASVALPGRITMSQRDWDLVDASYRQLRVNRGFGTDDQLKAIIEELYTGRLGRTEALDRFESELGLRRDLADANITRIIGPQLHQGSTLGAAARAPVRVAINGAGRIGVNVIRAWLARPQQMELVALNDVAFNFDRSGTQGLKDYVTLLEREFAAAPRSPFSQGQLKFAYGQDEQGYWISINGARIAVTDQPDPSKLPWADRQVDLVLEATGRFTSQDAASQHLQAGAKRVLITAPATGELLTVAPGINQELVNADALVYSCASCTTNAIAPPLKLISDAFGIETFYVSTTHAYTADQALKDTLRPGAFLRSREAAENIIPTSTGAAKAIGEVIPELAGKGTGIALRVPVPNGSIAGITAVLSRPTTKEELNRILRDTAAGPLNGIMAYAEDELVSRDILGRSESSIIAGNLTEVSADGRVATVWAWYDNEFGYSNRVLDLVELVRQTAQGAAPADAAVADAPATIPDSVRASLAAQLPAVSAAITGQILAAPVTILAQRITAVAGARTGEVSIDAAIAAGATGVIVGHSETRPGSPTPLTDSNEEINAQITAAAARQEIRTIILAVGEQEEVPADQVNRLAGFLDGQVTQALKGLTAEQLEDRLVIAYEPRWAIAGSGQGKAATPDYAEWAHQAIRLALTDLYGMPFAQRTRIIYGGSATAENAADYLWQSDIDGLLPGGASTATEKFVPILRAAQVVAASKETGRRMVIAGNQKTYAVGESPNDFLAKVVGTDTSNLDVAIAPTLTQLSAWATIAGSETTRVTASLSDTGNIAYISSNPDGLSGPPAEIALANPERFAQLPAPAQELARDQGALTNAKELRVVGASDQPELLKQAIASEKVVDLGGRYFMYSHRQDVARTVERTRVLSRNPEDQGEYNRWANTEELRPRALERMRGAATGKPLYVSPYLMSPPGSPLEKAAVGVQVTDSLAAVLNNNIMVRTEDVALKALGDGTTFVKGRYSAGDLNAVKRGNADIGFADEIDERDFFTVVDERETDHTGSEYGGNGLPKISHGLRQASYDGSKGFALGKPWLAEQMGLMEIVIEDIETGQEERIGAMVAAPSGSGKTNLVMLDKVLEVELNGRPSRVRVNLLGDDISWIWVQEDEQGQMRAFNPENGIFGIAPGTNGRTNGSAMQAIGPGSGTIFTNVGLNKTTKEVFWEGLETADFDWIAEDGYPKDLTGWYDWKGELITDRPADQQRNKKFPWAHPNSRFTTPLTNFKNLSPNWNNSNGIPVHMIILGGRSQTDPLVREARDLGEALYEAFAMGVEWTSAADGKAGTFGEDPWSMAPFYGLDEEAHLRNWLANAELAGAKMPKFFRSNVFRKLPDGTNAWEGYGENLRWLLWAVERIKSRGEYVETPNGLVPTVKSLHLEGSGMTERQVAAALAIDPTAMAWDIVRRSNHLAKFPDLPREVTSAHERFVQEQIASIINDNATIREAVAQYAKGGRDNPDAVKALAQALTAAGLPDGLVDAFGSAAPATALAAAPSVNGAVDWATIGEATLVEDALVAFANVKVTDSHAVPQPGYQAVVRNSAGGWDIVSPKDRLEPGDVLGVVEARRVTLRQVAGQMVPPTGGILAADESPATAAKRLSSVGLENTAENRQAMRRMLLTAPDLKASGVDAVILHQDTLTNTTFDDKTLIVDALREDGIVLVLKTDEGLVDDPAADGIAGLKLPKDAAFEKLPGMLTLAQESKAGATKYRTTVPGSGAPEANMRANAHAQAVQAKLTQEAGLVPMVEPEVTYDGSDGSAATHNLATAYATTTQMLDITFEELAREGAWLDGLVLKTSMILAGKKADTQTPAETVGFETLKGLLKTVPAEVAAVVFLSGGQSDDQATENLAAVTRVAETQFAQVRDAAVAELRKEGKTERANQVTALTSAPWEISYSFGRGLQAKALAAWAGQDANVDDAQLVMRATAREVQAARQSQATKLAAAGVVTDQSDARITLRTVAAQMVPPTGGILAADESAGTAGKRLETVGLENTPENRQAMRRVLLTTPDLKTSGIDAVILDRDTLTNTISDGKTLIINYLREQGITPGLKTDEGLVDDPAYPDTPGLKVLKDADLAKLPAVLGQAQATGMGFTKFRTTVPGSGAPEANMRQNAHAQARQAKLAQEAGLVPMVEPEVTFDGSDGSAATHDLATSYDVTTKMLDMTFEELANEDVWLDGMILKTSMVLAGKKAEAQTDPETVGRETLKVLLKTVPAEVAAVVFLSGGQSDDQATDNLQAVALISQQRFAEVRDAAVAELRKEGKTERASQIAALTETPWEISYSFGRGLQAPALKAWGGKPENIEQAQIAMFKTARKVQAARLGAFEFPEIPDAVAESWEHETGPVVALTPSVEVAQSQATADVRLKLRLPSADLPHPGKQNTTFIATATAAQFRGKGKEVKSAMDAAAKATSDAVTADQGRRKRTYAFEGELDVKLGDLQVEEASDAFDEAGALSNPKGFGEEEPSVDDVVEGTTAAATNNGGVSQEELAATESGGTSIRSNGPGIKGLGITPELYVLTIMTTVPPAQRAAIQKDLDPLVDEANPYEGMKATLTRLAQANGLGLADLHVVHMKRERETARAAALKRLQEEHGLEVTAITDGTVAPGIASTLGARDGKHVVMWSTSKSAEAYYNMIVARVRQRAGAVSATRLASFASLDKADDGSKPLDLTRWKSFNEEEQRKIRNARPADAEAVLNGTRILTPDDVTRPVEASMSLITDNGWFGLPGVQQISDDLFRVHTLRFSDAQGQGDGYAWVDTDDVSYSEVQKVVARGTFALQEPAAADPDVVDENGVLARLMEDAPGAHTIAVHAGIAAQTPGFFIALERALERYRAKHGYSSLQEASESSGLELILHVQGEGITEDNDVAAAVALLEAVAAASKGAVRPEVGWFLVASKPLSEYTLGAIDRVDVAIGPADWINESMAAAPVKVVVEAPATGDDAPVSIASGAAALYAGVAAAANDGKLPPEIAAKLDILDDGGFLTVKPSAAASAVVETAVREYQTALSTVEVGG